MNNIKVSSLEKTWIFDIDGTIVKHNGYKLDGYDSLLDGVKDFFESISEKDMIIFITSRKEEMKEKTEAFLKRNGIRYNFIIYNAPFGERILINDKKTSGLKTSIAINTKRDVFFETRFEVDRNL
jgi:hypothetical protein